jgi:hypothetical protein
MWVSLARGGGLSLAALAFMMWILRKILDPVIDMATSGPHAGHSTVQRISTYFAAMTLENLTLIAGLGVGLYLLGRAASERRVRA